MIQTFQEQFSNEILLSEKLRATLLSILSIVALIIFSSIILLERETMGKNLEDFTPVYITMLVFILFAFREYNVRRLIDRLIKREKSVPAFVRYVTMFMETSIPSIILITFAFYMKSTIVLLTPAVYLYFIIIALSTLSLDYRLSVFSGIVAAVEYLVIAFVLINIQESIPDVIILNQSYIPVGKGLLIFSSGAASGFVAHQLRKRIYNSFEIVNERNKVVNLFGQQVSKEIVDQLIAEGTELKSESKYVCIMFLDIQGFTPFAEGRKPEEIIDYQNKVFGFMIDIITDHNGIMNQLLGDGFMATFGAPIARGNDSQNAVNAAIKILDLLDKKNKLQEIPTTNVRIGLHAGNVVVGNVGTDIRKQYSISGNTVIIASRIEQLNKEYNSQLLISKEVLDNVETENLKITSLGEVKVKGREKPVHIFKHS